MRWREKQADECWIISECGFYAVSKTLDGDAGRAVYSAWYRYGAQPSSASGKPPLLLACKPEAGQATRACSEHQRSFNQSEEIEPDAEAA